MAKREPEPYLRKALIWLNVVELQVLIDEVEDAHLRGFSTATRTVRNLKTRLRIGLQRSLEASTSRYRLSLRQNECFVLIEALEFNGNGLTSLQSKVLLSYGAAITSQFEKELGGTNLARRVSSRDAKTGDFVKEIQ